MTSLRQTPESILMRREAQASAQARRRAGNDREARAAVRAALDLYVARHGAHAAGALASALAGDCFARVNPSRSAHAAACALFGAPTEVIGGLDFFKSNQSGES